MFCPITKKVSYETEHIALEKLIQNHIRNFHQGQGPTNIYQCDHCSNWHFTSTGTKHPDLDSPKMKEEIKKEQLGDYWERRLR